jgi:hypothetical protein
LPKNFNIDAVTVDIPKRYRNKAATVRMGLKALNFGGFKNKQTGWYIYISIKYRR